MLGQPINSFDANRPAVPNQASPPNATAALQQYKNQLQRLEIANKRRLRQTRDDGTEEINGATGLQIVGNNTGQPTQRSKSISNSSGTPGQFKQIPGGRPANVASPGGSKSADISRRGTPQLANNQIPASPLATGDHNSPLPNGDLANGSANRPGATNLQPQQQASPAPGMW